MFLGLPLLALAAVRYASVVIAFTLVELPACLAITVADWCGRARAAMLGPEAGPQPREKRSRPQTAYSDRR